jgi:hypothetical protein
MNVKSVNRPFLTGAFTLPKYVMMNQQVVGQSVQQENRVYEFYLELLVLVYEHTLPYSYIYALQGPTIKFWD